MSTQGIKAWPSVDVIPMDAWLERCWQEYRQSAGEDLPFVLSLAQEQAVWGQIVAESDAGRKITGQSSAAHEAARAWRLMIQYGVAISDLRNAAGDPATFAEWARQFAATCNREGCMSPAEVITRVRQLVAQGLFRVPERIIFAGFQAFTPAQARLREALMRAGCMVTDHPEHPYATSISRLECADPLNELRSAARWARKRMEEKSEARIAVVIPALTKLRPIVDRVFAETLHPTSLATPAWDGPRAFNVSAAPPLTGQAIVGAALLTLELLAGPLRITDLGRLFRAAFISGAQTEMNNRALLDAGLRSCGKLELTTSELAAVTSGTCPEWDKAIAQLVELQKNLPRQGSPAQWAAIFSQALDCMGWPGDDSVETVEWQAIRSWREVIAEYESLGIVVGPESYGQAFARLRTLAQAQLFQARSEDVPIHVIGTLEAAGLRFDCVWVAGLHEAAWPPAANPSPFLPREIQASREMPLASSRLAAEYAERVTQSLLQAAPEVILSFPARDGDRELRCSPLIERYAEADPGLRATDDGGLHRVLLGCAPTERISDFTAPSLEHGSHPPGGTYHVRDYAQCPFLAFAGRRLGAAALEEPFLGLNPLDRGSTVHAALAMAWEQLGSSAALDALSESELTRLCRHVAASAVREQQGDRAGNFGRIETDRIAALVEEWLKTEKERGTSFEVTVIEGRPRGTRRERKKRTSEPGTLSYAGLRFHARPDRVDAVQRDGAVQNIVIDYKTSSVKPSVTKWVGDRPEEPQLPMYCCGDDDFDGAAFAWVKVGSCCLNGVAAGDDVAPGIRGVSSASPKLREVGDWDSLKAAWKDTLERLAKGIREGNATPDPKSGQICSACDVSVLCRYAELAPDVVLTETEDAGGQEAGE